MNKKLLTISLFLSVIFTGCATTDLQVETKPTNSIFLDPIKRVQKTIYVEVKNSSGKEIDNFESRLRDKLRSQGYTVITDAKSAQYILMTNVLFAANSKEGVNGGAVAGGTFLGAMTGAMKANNGSGLLVGAAAGATAFAVASVAGQDEYYRFITDVLVKEKGVDSKYSEYTMRIFSQSVKMNLKTQEAIPVMVEQTVEQIAKIF